MCICLHSSTIRLRLCADLKDKQIRIVNRFSQWTLYIRGEVHCSLFGMWITMVDSRHGGKVGSKRFIVLYEKSRPILRQNVGRNFLFQKMHTPNFTSMSVIRLKICALCTPHSKWWTWATYTSDQWWNFTLSSILLSINYIYMQLCPSLNVYATINTMNYFSIITFYDSLCMYMSRYTKCLSYIVFIILCCIYTFS